MKKVFIALFFYLITNMVFGNGWNAVNGKTCMADKDFSTHQITFYESGNGLKKAIYQVNGSGVCAIFSLIYDVEIAGDSIFLKDGLNLDKNYTRKKNDNNYPPTELVLVRNGITLQDNFNISYKILRPSLICNWFYLSYEPITVDMLREIPIEKRMIYDIHSFNFLPNPKNCGNDNNPTLTSVEASFLNEYLKRQRKKEEFDFNNKKILFLTGSGGSMLGTKTDYFNDVREWKKKSNSHIATTFYVLSDDEKEMYGYDAIIYYWVKITSPKSRKKVLERVKLNALK